MANPFPDRSAGNAAGRPYVSKVSIVTGGAAAAELTLTGVRRGVDIIDSVVFTAKAAEALPVDVTSEASVPADGKIALSTTNTTSGRLEVFWRRKQP
jgi:hypothetical protein